MAQECPRDIMCHTCGREGHRMGDPECSLERISDAHLSQPDPVPSPQDSSCGSALDDPDVTPDATERTSTEQLPALSRDGTLPTGPSAATPASLGKKRSASSPVKSPGGGEMRQADKMQREASSSSQDEISSEGEESEVEETVVEKQWLKIPCSISPTLSIYLTRIVYGYSFLNTESTMTLKIITINTRGIVNNTKRLSLFYF